MDCKRNKARDTAAASPDCLDLLSETGGKAGEVERTGGTVFQAGRDRH